MSSTARAMPGTLSTIAGYIDTEVAAILAAVDTEIAAIKAKTDNPNSTKGYVYVDASLRLLSLQTASQSTNLTRAHIGLGLRF